ncbi:MAG: precorrin-3B C(17)-methyltransferase [Actinomycetota bacterium]|nr:precorrin-3B C(17)-methyltransferase [Actinomycetota bacterium]
MAAGNNIVVPVISKAGLRLAQKLEAESDDFTVYSHKSLNAKGYQSFDRVSEVVADLFHQIDGFVFIMAAGIATRTLAPHLENKSTDPGAVVVDEAGDYVISLVGGHEGGANALAYRVAAAIGGQAVISTGSEAQKPLTVGVGCRRGTPAADIKTAILDALSGIGAPSSDVNCLATIDEKRAEAGLLEAATQLDLPIRFFSAAELRANAGWTEISEPAMRAFGVGGVCEPAALLAGRGSRLILTKAKYEGVAVAIAAKNVVTEPRRRITRQTGFSAAGKGSIALVGIGQGDGQMTEAALTALFNATDIVGYKTYTKTISHLLAGQTVHESGMGKELDRAALAVRLARDGKAVAVISSGDSGIYGMAGPVLEILGDVKGEIDVRIVPGITAAGAAAAAVGAPLMNDFAVISLSDLMTPWPVIAGRIGGAAAADLVIALYNPKSRGRQDQLKKASRLIKKYRPGSTPAAVVRNAGSAPEVCLTDLDGLAAAFVDMRSTVIIGNSQSEVVNGWFVTKRGYRL